LPAAHGVQLAEPAGAKVPAGHVGSGQAPETPSEKVPAGDGCTEACEPAGQKPPAGQTEDVPLPEQTEPAGQRSGVVEPLAQ